MRKTVKALSLFLALLLMISGYASAEQPDPSTGKKHDPSAMEKMESSSYFQIDMGTSEEGRREPRNLRYICDGKYTFQKSSSRNGIGDFVPSEEGLAELCISGSAQYSLPQFYTLAEDLRKLADGKEIWIVDLRRESHVMMSQMAVSWHEPQNAGNPGLTLEEIEADEMERFSTLIGQTITLGGFSSSKHGKEKKEIRVTSFLTEKEMVESAGFHYLRIPIQDRCWPTPDQVDAFIDFVKSIDMNNVWLHFHCLAGMGRTGIMMTLYDKMKNPDVPLKDIAVRHAKLGSSYLLHEHREGHEAPDGVDKSVMMPLLFQYVEENHASGYEVSWSEWLAEHEPEAAHEPGVFGELAGMDGADERLAILEEVADPAPLTFSINGIGDVTISQVYCEGNRIYVSYKTSGNGIMVHDGLDLEDEAYADIIAGEETEKEDGTILGWKECILPDDRIADTVTFSLVFSTSPESEENSSISYTAEHHGFSHRLQGVSQAESYQAEAELYIGKVDTKGSVRIVSPEQAASWNAYYNDEESTGTDVISNWNLYRDGELVSADLFGASQVIGTDEVTFDVMFPRLDDLSGLTLVPEYSEAGEKPEEAIMLSTDPGSGKTVQEIQSRGVLRVGTAGDYRPMSYLDPETDTYVGFDAELTSDLAAALGVEIEYVPTSWPTLMEDTLAGKFDLAICGITVTDERKEKALMSDGYLGNGKTVLCRAEDAEKYTSLEAVNKPEVRVMENPGGLNEKFARENLPDATLLIHDVNQEIPGLVAAGEADVMITETMEAGYYVGQDSRLAAPLIYEPFTRGELGMLLPKGNEDLLAFVNQFIADERASGRLDELTLEYIYRYVRNDRELEPAA